LKRRLTDAVGAVFVGGVKGDDHRLTAIAATNSLKRVRAYLQSAPRQQRLT
jgi:hypothetical protein